MNNKKKMETPWYREQKKPSLKGIFDESKFVYDPTKEDQKQFYWLRKAILKAFRNTDYTVRESERLATSHAARLVEQGRLSHKLQAVADNLAVALPENNDGCKPIELTPEVKKKRAPRKKKETTE